MTLGSYCLGNDLMFLWSIGKICLFKVIFMFLNEYTISAHLKLFIKSYSNFLYLKIRELRI